MTSSCSSPLQPPQASHFGDVRQDISHLIARREWTLLKKVLKAMQDEGPANELSSTAINNLVGLQPCLRLACRFDPPLEAIVALDKAFPGSNKHCDCTGKYPIHFAAEWGASPKVIEYIVSKNKATAGFQDSFGKTPLHYMCDNYAKSCRLENAEERVKERMLKVARILCRAAPSSLNIEDALGMNALEYAIESGADYTVVRCLQKLSQKEWKARRKEGMNHINIEEDFKDHFEECKEIIKRENSLYAASLEKSVGDSAAIHPTNVRTRRDTTLKQKGCHLEKAIAA